MTAPTSPGEPESANSAEARLRDRLASGEESVEVLDALCATLTAQGKPVPPDLEERALLAHLARTPERYDLAFRLATLLMEQTKKLPPQIEEKALRHAISLAPGRLDLIDRLCTIVCAQTIGVGSLPAPEPFPDDAALLAEARAHLATAASSTRVLPSYGVRWAAYVERMHDAISGFSSSLEALRYAQTQVGFEHRRPVAVEARYFSLYDRELRLEFPQFADRLSGFRDIDAADPSTVIESDGRLLSNVTYYHARNVMTCLTHLPAPDVVLEIGGGFGLPALTWLTNPIHRPRLYVIVDIPESLFFAELTLERAFPGRVRYLTQDRRVTRAEFDDAVAVLCPVANLDALAGFAMDLVVNTGSLQEMSEEWIDHYMGWLDRQPVRYFFSLNYAVQPLSFLAESVNLWSPRPSPRWTGILLRWNPAFIRMQGDRYYLEAIFEKTGGSLTAAEADTAMARLMGRRLTGDVIIEALELVRRSLDPELILGLLRRIRDEFPFLPKEALWLTDWLEAKAPAAFLEQHRPEIDAFAARLNDARKRGIEGTV